MKTATLWRIEKGRLHLSLHSGQAAAWRSDRRFTFVLAGTQGGKTSFGPWWLWREIQRCGQGDYLAITASFDLFKLKMLPEIRMVFERLLGVARFWSGERMLELKDPTSGRFWAKRADDLMWGRIILRSAQSSGGLEAATAKAAWLDEVGQDGFTLEDWEAVQRRLSLAQGRCLGTTTIYNVGWLKHEVYDPWRDGDPDIECIQFPSYYNPAFPRAEYDRMEAKLPDWRFAMFYKGLFTRPAGLIYDAFMDDLLVDPFPIPLDWPRMVGVDFGGANTAILWAAQDPHKEDWYLYKEYLGGGKTSAEHAQTAKEGLGGAYEWNAVGGTTSETQSRLDWAEGGFALSAPRISEVEPGIDRGYGLFKGKRMHVFRTLRGTRDELGSYRRKLDPATCEPTDEILDKRKFHRLDAYRAMAIGIEEGVADGYTEC